MSQNPFGLTTSRVDVAISNILGRDMFAALMSGGIGRGRAHEMAMIRAFVYGADADSVMVLKAAKIYLDKNGEWPK